MIIHSLEIEGYRSYGEKQVINFEPGTLYLLTGDNRDRGKSSAAGKSTIFKAITTALFEQNDDDSIHDAAINTLQPDKGCRIALSFSDDGNNYYVVYARQHPEEGTHWTLYRWNGEAWDAERGARISDTKKIIRDRIKMSYDQFVNQAYIPQSKVADFIERTDKERKAIFGNILNLDECDKYSKAASTWRKELERDLTKGQGTLSILISQIEEIEKNPAPDIAYLEKELGKSQGELEKVKEQLAVLEEESKKLQSILDLTTQERLLSARLTQLDIRCQEAYSNLLLMPVEEIGRNVEAITEQVDDLNARSNIADWEVQSTKERITHINHYTDTCAECEQAIDDETREALLAKYESLLKEKEGVAAVLRESVEATNNAYNRERRLLEDASAKQANFYSLNSQKTEVEDELRKISENLTALREILGGGLNIPEEVEREKKEAQARQLRWTESVARLSETLHSAREKKAGLENLRKQRTSQIAANERNEKSIAYIRRCEELIGDKGFKSFKIHASRAAFNNSMGTSLATLTDGEVKAELVTEMPKADGKGSKTELDILVSDGEKKNVPIKQYSGGEKASLSLAITNAFCDLSVEQSDANINLLLLDEPFANLDTWGETQMCSLLENLTKSGRIVMVITNHQGVKERGSFEREIRAVKENHITRLEEYDLSGEH